MTCDKCDKEPTVYLLDKKQYKMPEHKLQRGMVIECDDPKSFEKYCEEHWQEKLRGR